MIDSINQFSLESLTFITALSRNFLSEFNFMHKRVIHLVEKVCGLMQIDFIKHFPSSSGCCEMLGYKFQGTVTVSRITF